MPGAQVGETARRRRPFRRPRRVPPSRARRRRRRHPRLPRGVPRRRRRGRAGEGDRGGCDASVRFANDAVVEAERTAKRREPPRTGTRSPAASAAGGVTARIATAAVEAFDGSLARPCSRPVRAAPVPRVRDGGVARLAPASPRDWCYLSVWLDAYSGGDSQDDATESPVDAATEPPEGFRVARGGGVGGSRHRHALHAFEEQRIRDAPPAATARISDRWRRQARGGEASGWVRQRGRVHRALVHVRAARRFPRIRACSPARTPSSWWTGEQLSPDFLFTCRKYRNC